MEIQTETSTELVKIVEASGLETTKAQILLKKFTNFFQIASDWEKKARAIVVTDESQKAEMKMAREGRLFLKNKRVEVEKARKELKEQSLREGQTIDSIARILKNLIEPTENYLEEQETFAERKETERRATLKAERIQALQPYLEFVSPEFLSLDIMTEEDFQRVLNGAKLQLEAKIEEQRQAELNRIKAEKEEAERKEKERIEQEKIKAENERLKREFEKSESLRIAEQKKADEILEFQRNKAKQEAEKQAKIQVEIQAKKDAEVRAEREKREKLEEEIREQKRLEYIAQREKKEAEIAAEKARIEAAKAPIKEQLKLWVDSFEIPAQNSGEQVVFEIKAKFELFKSWSKNEINKM